MQIYSLFLDQIDSTHLFAKRSLSSFPKDALTYIAAKIQTGGIGSRGRKWTTLPGDHLFASFVFSKAPFTPFLPMLGEVLAVSASAVLSRYSPDVEIKFPNDLQLEEKKLGGILTEILDDFVIASIGLNVSCDREEMSLWSISLGQAATSLLASLGKAPSLKELHERLPLQFSRDLFRLFREGFSPFQQEINRRLAKKGKLVSLRSGRNVFKGICEAIGPGGELLLRQESGELVPVRSGDLIPNITAQE